MTTFQRFLTSHRTKARPGSAARLPSRLRPVERRALDLQRSAGNRAVAGLVAQRKMAFGVKDLQGSVSWRARLKGKASTFAQLTAVVHAYEKESADPMGPQALAHLGAISALSEKWLKHHSVALTPGQRKKHGSVAHLHAAAEAERHRVRAGYWDALQAGRFKMLSPDKANQEKVKGAAELAHGRAPASPVTNFAQDYAAEIADLTGRYGLSAAEIAAIRIYSDQDYKYINPAVGGIKGWLDDNVKDPSKRGQAAGEGGLHGELAKWGLRRLPEYRGKVYRGEVREAGDIATKYRSGAKARFDGFMSTSKDRGVSENFIFNELGEHRKEAPQKKWEGVLHIISGARGGREIGAMSVNPHEQEVLFPPGASVTVSGLRMDKGTPREPHIVEARGK